MSSNGEIVRANGLSKLYKIYRHPRHRIQQLLFGSKQQLYTEFWALRDVSFSMNRGQTLGVIGKNGSGKSTLLQIICGIFPPTLGNVTLGGRVSALLELGSGFNSELSGKDNIMISGAVLGLDEEEVRSKQAAIVDFAGIGKFIDLPVKTYSSGMFVRLAFSVAVHVDPEILVVDEALSVGDIEFQQKCFKRIQDLRERGLGMIFVSHDLETVKRLCSQCIVLYEGRVVYTGDPKEAAAYYIGLISLGADRLRSTPLGAGLSVPALPRSSPEHEKHALTDPPVNNESSVEINDDLVKAPASTVATAEVRHGDGTARVLGVRLFVGNELSEGLLFLEEDATIEVATEFLADYVTFVIGVMIKDRFGVELLALNTAQEKVVTPVAKSGDRFLTRFRFVMPLNPGEYSLSATIALDQYSMKWMDWVDNIARITVVDRKYNKLHFGIVSPSGRETSIRLHHCADFVAAGVT